MRGNRGKHEDGQSSILSSLHENSPISVVKAARASLKDPSRPFTPDSSTRRALGGGDGLTELRESSLTRLGTSHGQAPTSRSFYEGPRLPLIKVSDSSSSGPRLPLVGVNRMSLKERDPSPSEMRLTGGNKTHAQSLPGSATNLKTQRADSFTRPSFSDSPIEPSTSGIRATSNQPSLPRAPQRPPPEAPEASPQRPPPTPSSNIWMTASPSDPNDEDETPTAYLDPRRNDDLPPRPQTSRGRPTSSSSNNALLDPAVSTTFKVPVPKQPHKGSEVLEISPGIDEEDEEEDDADYKHLYTYGPRAADDLAQHPNLGNNPTSTVTATPSKNLPPKPPAPTKQGSLERQHPIDDPLDPSDPAYAWRATVERSLVDLSATSEASLATLNSPSPSLPMSQQALVDLLKDLSVLGAHVEYMRKQPGSSRWLNAPCLTFREASGGALSIREAIADHVFRLMDVQSPELLLKACGVILRVVKSRQPLLQTSKVLYRLSKDTANDNGFKKERLLEPILKTVSVMMASCTPGSGNAALGPSSMHEPLVYLGGCLKNISNEPSNQRQIIKLGGLSVLSSLLVQTASTISTATLASAPGPPTTDFAIQVIVQATAVMRNLAISASHASLFISSGVLPALHSSVQSALPSKRPQGDSKEDARYEEVVLNVGRILSKLSVHDDFQTAFESDPVYSRTLMGLLWQYKSNKAILLRLAFVLGNVTTSSEDQRKAIATYPGAIASIVSILSLYSSATVSGDESERTSGGTRASEAISQKLNQASAPADCCIKMLRLIANLAIHEEVGPLLASQSEVARDLLDLLSWSSSSSSAGSRRAEEVPSDDEAIKEELVLNCVCALTNLSYYHDLASKGGGNQVLEMDPEGFLAALTPLLMSVNEECQVEAARAYGNFSRIPTSREYIFKSRVLEAMILLLDHGNLELVYSICGTLINFTVDRRRELVAMGGVSNLIDLLERVVTSSQASELEASIIEVVFKALFNICVDEADPGKPIKSKHQSPVTEDEISTLEAIIEHIQEEEDLNLGPDVMALAKSLATILQAVAKKLDTAV